MHTWTMDDAENHFEEVVRRAVAQGAQRITRNGQDAVVVLSAEAYEQLAAPGNLVDFLRNSPLAEALASGELVLDRDWESGRDITT